MPALYALFPVNPVPISANLMYPLYPLYFSPFFPFLTDDRARERDSDERHTHHHHNPHSLDSLHLLTYCILLHYTHTTHHTYSFSCSKITALNTIATLRLCDIATLLLCYSSNSHSPLQLLSFQNYRHSNTQPQRQSDSQTDSDIAR